jgi:molecular chaperone HscB
MKNYFELLSIEMRYDIDLQMLNTQYLAMQSKYHPDWAKTNEEKQSNLSISIDINKAYSVLKCDLSRSKYLLFLHNIVLDELILKQDISRESLDYIWEELELVEYTKELVDLEHILNDKILKKNKLLESLIFAFQSNNMQNALDITIKLQYIQNLLNKLQLKIKNLKI